MNELKARSCTSPTPADEQDRRHEIYRPKTTRFTDTITQDLQARHHKIHRPNATSCTKATSPDVHAQRHKIYRANTTRFTGPAPTMYAYICTESTPSDIHAQRHKIHRPNASRCTDLTIQFQIRKPKANIHIESTSPDVIPHITGCTVPTPPVSEA